MTVALSLAPKTCVPVLVGPSVTVTSSVTDLGDCCTSMAPMSMLLPDVLESGPEIRANVPPRWSEVSVVTSTRGATPAVLDPASMAALTLPVAFEGR